MTASGPGTVAEPARKLRQKAGLNWSMLTPGWSEFAGMISYKLEDRGGHLLCVPAAYTSRTCSICDHVDASSRESQASFVCMMCGQQDNAYINAAKNIWRRNTALLDVEGLHRQPYEASTSGVLHALEIPVL